MKVVVTGAAGFLGGHIARKFRDVGWEVTAFDVAPVDEQGIHFAQGDLTDGNSVDQAVAGADVVAHVGAIGDVYLAGEQPTLAAEVNVLGTANVIEAALRHEARLVYASTWEVYGEPRYEPLDEDHPTMPDHPYSITKLGGESLVLAATHLRSLSALALRLGTAYGSGLRPNSVFRIFIDRARRGEPITIQGDGSQGRQFTHSSDIARAFHLAADSEASGIALNTVASETVTIRELAEKIVQRFPTELTFGEARPGDVPPATVSAKRAEEVLGWHSEMPFDRGLQELIDGLVYAG
ncbi:MAG TPA: NAD-dependent epimerase/dehydratase family protein [Acidimicrobiia bacterium]|nr:NAD-dependent epimerase/dehydratase family protein [Acidimicrobiia bacterium]